MNVQRFSTEQNPFVVMLISHTLVVARGIIAKTVVKAVSEDNGPLEKPHAADTVCGGRQRNIAGPLHCIQQLQDIEPIAFGQYPHHIQGHKKVGRKIVCFFFLRACGVLPGMNADLFMAEEKVAELVTGGKPLPLDRVFLVDKHTVTGFGFHSVSAELIRQVGDVNDLHRPVQVQFLRHLVDIERELANIFVVHKHMTVKLNVPHGVFG